MIWSDQTSLYSLDKWSDPIRLLQMGGSCCRPNRTKLGAGTWEGCNLYTFRSAMLRQQRRAAQLSEESSPGTCETLIWFAWKFLKNNWLLLVEALCQHLMVIRLWHSKKRDCAGRTALICLRNNRLSLRKVCKEGSKLQEASKEASGFPGRRFSI